MPCTHLQKLYQLCVDSNIKLSGSDLVHIVCEECGIQEACPSMLMDEYDHKHRDEVSESKSDDSESVLDSNS